MTTMAAMPGTSNNVDSAYDRYDFNTYTVHKKFFKLFGGAFSIFDPDGHMAFYSKQKAFKLKEDIRLYTDESMQTEVMTIQAREVLDFSASYDVVDTLAGEMVGALRRKGLKSIFKDEWIIMDEHDNQIGLIKEDSALLATLRRFIDFAALLLPQSFHGEINGQTICKFSQNFNPFLTRISLDFSLDQDHQLDRRLGIAAAVLLCAIEGKQKG